MKLNKLIYIFIGVLSIAIIYIILFKIKEGIENKISYNIIIARYNEPLDWVEKLEKKHVIIYNKGDTHIENSIRRKNVGREGETFIYHIIKNYYNLPDYLIMIQGNPFDHMNNITPDNFQDNINDLIKRNIHETQPLFTNEYNEEYDIFPGIISKEYYTLFFEGDVPKKNRFAAGAQYIIPKSCITHRPIQFYKKLYIMILQNKKTYSDAHHNTNTLDHNYIDGWCLERLLWHIFSKNIKSSNYMINQPNINIE